MHRFLTGILALALVGFAVFWLMTRPEQSSAATLVNIEPSGNGQDIFNAAGCASCHSAPNATGDEKLKLGGGQKFATPFGTFIAPNISNDPEFGIGNWSDLDLLNALWYGTSPKGTHYFPVFPYGTYTRMAASDVMALRRHLATLPSVQQKNEPHQLGFPFNIRRTVGGWKLLNLDRDWVVDTAPTPQLERGRYLVEALGHCGECHTKRDALGGLDLDLWLGGAPNPVGKGTIPNLTRAKLDWSEADIAHYLSTGFTPEFDTAGGEMVSVIENMNKLPDTDLLAIAAYLKTVPPVE